MRISKQTAEDIAKILCNRAKENIKILEKELEQYLFNLVDKEVPQEVKEFYKKHPQYFDVVRQVSFEYYGNRKYFSIPGSVISSQGNSCIYLRVDAKQNDIITKMYLKIEKSQKAYKTLLSDTTNALLTLKTTKNIAEQFPEILQYLPTPASSNTQLIVNFDTLKCKLKHQGELSKLETLCK